jgi:hypothetical protein
VVGDDGPDHRERAVARLVAVLVVDALEVVEVEADPGRARDGSSEDCGPPGIASSIAPMSIAPA